MQVNIRIAGRDDAELIADLSRKTFYDTFAPDNTKENMDRFMREQFSRSALMQEVGEKDSIFFLAYADDQPVGYARLREKGLRFGLENKSPIEIARIYAVNDKIGKGVGSALMQQCMDTAREMKKEVIWLGVWKKNHRAVDFYTKWGFEIFGEQDFILGRDVQKDWLMKKDLDQQ